MFRDSQIYSATQCYPELLQNSIFFSICNPHSLLLYKSGSFKGSHTSLSIGSLTSDKHEEPERTDNFQYSNSIVA